MSEQQQSTVTRQARPWARVMVCLTVVLALTAVIIVSMVSLSRTVTQQWDERTSSVTAADWQSLVVDESQLDRWMSFESQYLPTSDQSFGVGNNLFARAVVAIYERDFLGYPGPRALQIIVTDTRSTAVAQTVAKSSAAKPKTDPRFEASDATWWPAKDSSNSPVVTVDFSKGRVATHIVITGAEGSFDDAAWDDLLDMAVAVANAQYSKMPMLDDVSLQGGLFEQDNEKIFLWVSELLFVMVVAVLAYFTVGMSVQGRWDLIKPNKRREPTSHVAPIVDVSRAADKSAWRVVTSSAASVACTLIAVTIGYFTTPEIFKNSDTLTAKGSALLVCVLGVVWTIYVVYHHRISPLGRSKEGSRLDRTIEQMTATPAASTVLLILQGWCVLALLAVAFTIWGVIAAMSVLPAAATGNISNAFVIVFLYALILVLLLVCLLVAPLVRRLTSPIVRSIVSRDKRQPVLLLRSFSDDPLTIRDYSTSQRTNLERTALGPRARFEEWLAWKMWPTGPVMSISRPGAKTTRTISVAREMPGDKEWPNRVTQGAAASRLVVAVLDRSPSIIDEIALLQQAQALPRTVFMMPPVSPDEAQFRLSILSTAMGLEPGVLDGSLRSGQHPLAIHFDDRGQPTVIASSTRSSLSYQAGLDACGQYADCGGWVPSVLPVDLVRRMTAGKLSSGHGTAATPMQRLRLRGVTWQKIALALLVVVACVGVAVSATRMTNQSQAVVYPGPVFAPVSILNLAAWDDATIGLGTANDLYRIDSSGVQSLGALDESPNWIAAHGDQIVVSWDDPTRLAAYRVVGASLQQLWSTTLDGVDHTRGLALTRQYAVLALPDTDSVIVISLDDGSVYGHVTVGPMPWDVARWGDNVVVVMPGSEELQVVDPSTLSVLTPFEVGLLPSAIQIDADAVWAVSVSGETVSRVPLAGGEAMTASVSGPFSRIAGFGDVAVVPTSGSLNGLIPYGIAAVNVKSGENTLITTTGFQPTVAVTSDGVLAATNDALVNVALPGQQSVPPAQVIPDATTWQPEGSWLPVVVRQIPFTDGDHGCGLALTERQWTSQDRTRDVTLDMASCGTSGTAYQMVQDINQQGLRNGTAGQTLLVGADSLVTTEDPRPTAMRVWAQGTDLYLLTVSDQDETLDSVVADNATFTTAFSGQAGGGVVSSATLTRNMVANSFLVPIFVYFVYWGIFRLFTFARPSAFAMSEPTGMVVPAESVQREVSRVRSRRFFRRLIYIWGIPCAVVLVGLVAGVVMGSPPSLSVLNWCVLILSAAMLFALPWALRKNPIERKPPKMVSHSARGDLGGVLQVFSQILFVASIAGYVFGSYAALLDERSVRPNTGAHGLAGVEDAIRVGLATLSIRLGSGLFFLLILMSVLCYLLNRFGQRLRTASMPEIKHADAGRPDFLYLRSFDEDRLRIRSTLRGAGPIGVLTPLRRAGFEEVIASSLSRIAPVIAVNPPDVLLPPMGAARLTVGPDQDWHQVISTEAANSRAVIVSATPQSVNDGFWFELQTVANLPHQRVILVMGPWKKDLEHRWTVFRSMVSTLPFFAPIAAYPVPVGTQVLAHNPWRGWKAFGALARTDFSYAICLDHAVAWVDSSGPVPQPSTVNQSATLPPAPQPTVVDQPVMSQPTTDSFEYRYRGGL